MTIDANTMTVIVTTLTTTRDSIEALKKGVRPSILEMVTELDNRDTDYLDGSNYGFDSAIRLIDDTIRGFAKEDEVCPECSGNNINWDKPECRDCKGGPND